MSAKHKLIAKLISTVLVCFGLGKAHAAPAPVRYSCPARGSLTIRRDGSSARVMLAGQAYELTRRPSSIGDKYISSTAALIIDGATAVFVANNHPDLGTCSKAVPVASAR